MTEELFGEQSDISYPQLPKSGQYGAVEETKPLKSNVQGKEPEFGIFDDFFILFFSIFPFFYKKIIFILFDRFKKLF